LREGWRRRSVCRRGYQFSPFRAGDRGGRIVGCRCSFVYRRVTAALGLSNRNEAQNAGNAQQSEADYETFQMAFSAKKHVRTVL
jgi:hypothetical protein